MPISRPPHGDAYKRSGAINSVLQVKAQLNPNLTVKIQAGGFWKNENQYIETPELNVAIVKPNTNVRYAVVCLRENGTAAVVYGTAVASNPDLPTNIPTGYCPLAAVYTTSSTNIITEDMIYDLRPFFRAGNATVDHANTSNRNAANSHPISAITGLQEALDGKITIVDLEENLANKADFDGTTSPDFILNKGYSGVSAENCSIIVNRGADTDVAIRWNEDEEYWEYTNDGVEYQSFTTPTLPAITLDDLDSSLQDIIGGKADSTHGHEVTDIVDFATEVRTAAVGNAINSNVTDIAPSQDAVFQALAGKADDSHTHIASDITDFTTAVSDSVITSQIAAGSGYDVVAPSATAVHNALQEKVDLESNDDLTFLSDAVGVILTSPGLLRYRIIVDDAGVLSTEQVI